MGIQRSQEDAWTKEQAKWEHRPVLVNGTYVEPIPFSAGGKGNAPFREYPKAMYRAESADGGPRINGMITVDDEQQERMQVSNGWSASQTDALDRVAAQNLEFARLAANRAYNDKWMSEAARAEAQAVDERTMQHLPSIPTTPIKKRGRPARVKAPTIE